MSPPNNSRIEELGEVLRQAFPDRFGAATIVTAPPPKRGWGDVISGAALVLSVCSIVWTGGVIYGQQQEHTRRIAALEMVDQGREPLFRELLVKLSRIEADVASMKERER